MDHLPVSHTPDCHLRPTWDCVTRGAPGDPPFLTLNMVLRSSELGPEAPVPDPDLQGDQWTFSPWETSPTLPQP
jgi:hypothetical protein